MISLIPIFSEKEQLFWRSEDANELLCKVINVAIHASEVSRVIVCTNEKNVLMVAKCLNIDVFFLEFDCEADPNAILPLGSLASTQYVSNTLKLDLEDLLIISFKNPLISSDFINRAIEKYHNSTMPIVISGTKPVDHPCQLSAYYKRMDTGCIHIFEENYDLAPSILAQLNSLFSSHNSNDELNRIIGKPYDKYLPYTMTKPFYFDWPSKNISEKSDVGTYFRTYQDQSVSYQPIEQFEALRQRAHPTVFWMFESNQSARLLFHNDVFKKTQQQCNSDHDLTLHGVAFDECENQVTMALYAGHSVNIFYLNCLISPEISSSYLVKALALDSSMPPCQNAIADMHFDNLNSFIPFQHHGEKTSSILYSLLEISGDDTYDLSEQFPAPRELWSSSGTHLKVNVKTGKAIMGRQDFPDVIEIDGTLIILKKEVLSSLSHEIAAGNAEFIFIQENESIQINSGFDFLKYLAISRISQA